MEKLIKLARRPQKGRYHTTGSGFLFAFAERRKMTFYSPEAARADWALDLRAKQEEITRRLAIEALVAPVVGAAGVEDFIERPEPEQQ